MKDSHIESRKRLEHILIAIDHIGTFVQHETLASFCQNAIVNNAVLFQFTGMGEAIAHVESEKLNKYEYPWYKVRSFRNLIAHEYFNIKMEAVWTIILHDIPNLKAVVKEILENEF